MGLDRTLFIRAGSSPAQGLFFWGFNPELFKIIPAWLILDIFGGYKVADRPLTLIPRLPLLCILNWAWS